MNMHKFTRWFFIIAILIALVLWGILAVIQFVASRQSSTASDQPPTDQAVQKTYQPEEAYPEATAFLNGYFDQISRGNVAELQKSYWTSDVPDKIRQACSNPLGGGDETIEQLWASCAYLRGVHVQIIDLVKTDSGYKAVVQLLDENNKVVGIELHPERSKGVSMTIEETSDGLRTPDWNLLSSYE